MIIIAWSSAALLMGFILDMIFGDPYHFPHIVRWMGCLIAALDKRLPRSAAGGVVLVCVVTTICTAIPLAALFLLYCFIPFAGFVLESYLCWQLLAAKSLKVESMKVYYNLRDGDIEVARKNISMIVGRDTAVLNESGVTRAAVETVAENTCDGVIAPLLYIMFGGAILGCFYKAVNTMDSMVGYKNDKYLHFGRAAAKTDDALNYLPSRFSALLMIAAVSLLRFDGKGAFRIWKRDRRKHASPNSAQTESVCAGALGIRLAGPISYFGEMREKPYIGDDTRPVHADDIVRSNRLMYATSTLMLMISLLFRAICLGVLFFATV